MNTRNPFAASTLARLTDRRGDAAWLEQALAADTTWLLPVWADQIPVRSDERARLGLIARADAAELVDAARETVLLGEHAGRPCFALDMGETPPGAMPAGVRGLELAGLREIAALGAPEDAALAAYARALLHWHRHHRFCGRCGAPTLSAEGGHQRHCSSESCTTVSFPRTDPAIIVLVEDGERCLLGRQASWPAGRYSTLAGFVEPGEALEDAVAREVMEETGVRVLESRYHSCQPWPFPASLMLGFIARGAPDPVRLHDQELEDARWFSRHEMIAALESGTLKMSTSISIAYRLVSDWFDADEPGRLETLLAELRAP